MIKVYVETDADFDKVLNISTISQNVTDTEAFYDETLDLSKMSGFRLLRKEDGYYVIFDETVYEAYVKEKEKEEAIKAGETLKQQLTEKLVLQSANDEDAYTMRYSYDAWEPNIEYETNIKVLYSDVLYKCIKPHTSEEGVDKTPDKLSTLWTAITK